MTKHIEANERLPSFSPSVIHVPSDVILFLSNQNTFILHNVFTRTSIEINQNGLPIISFLKDKKSEHDLKEFINHSAITLQLRDLTIMSTIDGLFEDPSNMLKNQISITALPLIQNVDEAITLLKNRFIVISDECQYRQMFGPKKNILDGKHFGNFHQQMGREILLNRREDPAKWWPRQKFSEDCRHLNDNFYKFVQFHFYEIFFGQNHSQVSDKKILDVGCGPGFYSNYLASLGACVTGIDPNPDYIQTATANIPQGMKANYEVMDIGSGHALKSIPNESYDFIFFQDALLFYFVPYESKDLTTRDLVLSELSRILTKQGRLYVIDPHGIFWLSPWWGGIDRPFTILTEYQNKTYGVTPNLSQISEAFYQAGLLIQRVLEPKPSKDAERVNPRGYHFTNQFPLWWVFELVKRVA